MRAFLQATRFLTRLPVPHLPGDERRGSGASAAWFPAVGGLIGLIVAATQHALAGADAWLAALTAVLAWLWITGGLHIDGAADFADALGARHRRPERFLEVLHDPRVGTFGVLAILCIVLAKLVALHAMTQHASVGATLMLLPAWMRFGALLWARTLPPLVSGHGERFGAEVKDSSLVGWGAVLLVLSVAFSPLALGALLVIPCWWIFLRVKIGGMNGDTLGAGIEWCEASTLLLSAIAARSAIASEWLEMGLAFRWLAT